MRIMIMGASGGIGRILTESFDSVENELFLTYNSSKENIHSTKYSKSNLFKCNFTKREEVIQTFEKIESLDVLINVMGHVENNLIKKMTEGEWDRVIASNLKTVFLSCKYGISKISECGHIINISSVLKSIGMIGATNYVSAKGAVEAFTKSFALECIHNGGKIFVNGISLGYFNVGMGLKLSKKIKKYVLEKIPLKKFGDPKEISNVVKFLISSKYIVGQIIEINGGLRI